RCILCFPSRHRSETTWVWHLHTTSGREIDSTAQTTDDMRATAPPEELQFADIDRHFARFIARFGGDAELIEQVTCLLSQAVREGHICLDLSPANIARSLLPTNWCEHLNRSP